MKWMKHLITLSMNLIMRQKVIDVIKGSLSNQFQFNHININVICSCDSTANFHHRQVLDR